jgi:O-antigen ligase
MFGLMLYRWQWRWLRGAAVVAFVLTFVGLFLGQSRFALLGVFVALGGLIALLIPSRRWRYAGFAGLGLMVLIEAALVLNLFPASRTEVAAAQSAAEISARDENSLAKRVLIWESGLHIIADYPLTGAGMSMFRYGPVRLRYPVPTYETRILPHAHDEWIQIGTDMGLPGLIVFIAWQVVVGWMLWRGWRTGDQGIQVMAAAVGAGLLAHALFGLGDAIPLWDRLAFVYWWLLGLAGAVYVLAKDAALETPSAQEPLSS